jgi:hypothetical protein
LESTQQAISLEQSTKAAEDLYELSAHFRFHSSLSLSTCCENGNPYHKTPDQLSVVPDLNQEIKQRSPSLPFTQILAV